MEAREFYEEVMKRIGKLEKLQQENKNHIIRLNTKINGLGMIIMLDNIFNDIEDDAE